MQLFKFRNVIFNRIDEDEFIAQLTDEYGNIVMTMEPRKVEEGENYAIEFPNDNVIARERMPS
jgi:hypothetical protein